MQGVSFCHFTGDTFIQKSPLASVLHLACDMQMEHPSGHVPLLIQRLALWNIVLLLTEMYICIHIIFE